MKKNFVLFLFLLSPLLLSKPSERILTLLQIPFVLVDDAGNKADTSAGGRGLGSLSKNFLIGKYEITASQYCSFLTAVASHEDPHHLYKKEMGTDPQVACITQRELADGTYQYDLIDQRGMLPITYVTLRDAQRFCNWLENKCPSYQEGATTSLAASTEKGAYQIMLQEGKEVALFNPQAHYYIPTESEWVKAAYYKGGGTDRGYWNYPTQSDSAPNNGHGDVSNQANYGTLASHWTPPKKNPVLTPVDYFSKTESFYGACDLGGNVAEWTCSLCDEEDLLANPPSTEAVRGGSWKSYYSIWWDNELMSTSTPSYYDSLTATNFIGFRIAATLEEPPPEIRSNEMSENCHEIDNSTSSFIFWTFLKGLLFGCPRTMIQTIAERFGFDAATLLGVENISATSLKVILSIVAIDLLGYVAIMAAFEIIYYLVPWNFLKDYTLETFASFWNLL